MANVRLVREADFENLWQIVQDGDIGLTTLPKDKASLEKRIKLSIHSQLNPPNQFNEVQYYLFVLEDTVTSKIMGTAGILAATGVDEPFYSYRMDSRGLIFCEDLQYRTELCTFFIHPKYRHLHLGRILSLTRLTFIKKNPERFCDEIIAELRGFSDENGISPVWEAIGKRFFNIPYNIADAMTLSHGKQYIRDNMPPHCIPFNLISKKVIKTLKQVHPNTKPALKILQDAGFEFSNYVDIFDGGPTLVLKRELIV
jgi:arginine N-succinyltransferase